MEYIVTFFDISKSITNGMISMLLSDAIAFPHDYSSTVSYLNVYYQVVSSEYYEKPNESIGKFAYANRRRGKRSQRIEVPSKAVE